MIYTVDNLKCDFEISEVLRYMGCKGTDDTEIISLAQNATQEVKKVIEPKACYIKTDIQVKGDEIDFGICNIKSGALAKNLLGCKGAYLFAVTVGTGVDRLLVKSRITSPAACFAIDNAASAAIEAVVDALCEQFKEAEENKGNSLRPRFSAGFGDLDISFQKELLRLLDASRKIGISLTNGCMMVPTKSVTAIMGIK